MDLLGITFSHFLQFGVDSSGESGITKDEQTMRLNVPLQVLISYNDSN